MDTDGIISISVLVFIFLFVIGIWNYERPSYRGGSRRIR